MLLMSSTHSLTLPLSALHSSARWHVSSAIDELVPHAASTVAAEKTNEVNRDMRIVGWAPLASKQVESLDPRAFHNRVTAGSRYESSQCTPVSVFDPGRASRDGSISTRSVMSTVIVAVGALDAGFGSCAARN